MSQSTKNVIWVCLKMLCTPKKPNGFADHYPVFKWLFHWEYTQHFQTNSYFCMSMISPWWLATCGSGNERWSSHGPIFEQTHVSILNGLSQKSMDWVDGIVLQESPIVHGKSMVSCKVSQQNQSIAYPLVI